MFNKFFKIDILMEESIGMKSSSVLRAAFN